MVDLKINDTIIHDVELIIFDKDGTLFRLYPFWSELAARRARILRSIVNPDDDIIEEELIRSMGIDRKNRRMFPTGPIGIYPRRHIIVTVQRVLREHSYEVGEKRIESAFFEADEQMADPEILRRTMLPVEGAFDFLDSVKGRCKCAILSSDRTSRLEQVATIFEIAHHFDILLGGDRTKVAKPDPWGAKKIMEDLGIGPEKTLFIGDSMADIECACNSGCAHKIAIISDITDANGVAGCSGLIVRDFTEIETIQKE